MIASVTNLLYLGGKYLSKPATDVLDVLAILYVIQKLNKFERQIFGTTNKFKNINYVNFSDQPERNIMNFTDRIKDLLDINKEFVLVERNNYINNENFIVLSATENHLRNITKTAIENGEEIQLNEMAEVIKCITPLLKNQIKTLSDVGTLIRFLDNDCVYSKTQMALIKEQIISIILLSKICRKFLKENFQKGQLNQNSIKQYAELLGKIKNEQLHSFLFWNNFQKNCPLINYENNIKYYKKYSKAIGCNTKQKSNGIKPTSTKDLEENIQKVTVMVTPVERNTCVDELLKEKMLNVVRKLVQVEAVIAKMSKSTFSKKSTEMSPCLLFENLKRFKRKLLIRYKVLCRGRTQIQYIQDLITNKSDLGISNNKYFGNMNRNSQYDISYFLNKIKRDIFLEKILEITGGIKCNHKFLTPQLDQSSKYFMSTYSTKGSKFTKNNNKNAIEDEKDETFLDCEKNVAKEKTFSLSGFEDDLISIIDTNIEEGNDSKSTVKCKKFATEVNEPNINVCPDTVSSSSLIKLESTKNNCNDGNPDKSAKFSNTLSSISPEPLKQSRIVEKKPLTQIPEQKNEIDFMSYEDFQKQFSDIPVKTNVNTTTNQPARTVDQIQNKKAKVPIESNVSLCKPKQVQQTVKTENVSKGNVQTEKKTKSLKEIIMQQNQSRECFRNDLERIKSKRLHKKLSSPKLRKNMMEKKIGSANNMKTKSKVHISEVDKVLSIPLKEKDSSRSPVKIVINKEKVSTEPIKKFIFKADNLVRNNYNIVEPDISSSISKDHSEKTNPSNLSISSKQTCTIIKPSSPSSTRSTSTQNSDQINIVKQKTFVKSSEVPSVYQNNSEFEDKQLKEETVQIKPQEYDHEKVQMNKQQTSNTTEEPKIELKHLETYPKIDTVKKKCENPETPDHGKFKQNIEKILKKINDSEKKMADNNVTNKMKESETAIQNKTNELLRDVKKAAIEIRQKVETVKIKSPKSPEIKSIYKKEQKNDQKIPANKVIVKKPEIKHRVALKDQIDELDKMIQVKSINDLKNNYLNNATQLPDRSSFNEIDKFIEQQSKKYLKKMIKTNNNPDSPLIPVKSIPKSHARPQFDKFVYVKSDNSKLNTLDDIVGENKNRSYFYNKPNDSAKILRPRQSKQQHYYKIDEPSEYIKNTEYLKHFSNKMSSQRPLIDELQLKSKEMIRNVGNRKRTSSKSETKDIPLTIKKSRSSPNVSRVEDNIRPSTFTPLHRETQDLRRSHEVPQFGDVNFSNQYTYNEKRSVPVPPRKLLWDVHQTKGKKVGSKPQKSYRYETKGIVVGDKVTNVTYLVEE